MDHLVSEMRTKISEAQTEIGSGPYRSVQFCMPVPESTPQWTIGAIVGRDIAGEDIVDIWLRRDGSDYLLRWSVGTAEAAAGNLDIAIGMIRSGEAGKLLSDIEHAETALREAEQEVGRRGIWLEDTRD